MSLSTLFPYQPSFDDEKPVKYQGRSQKLLRPVVEHDGRVFVARYEGRRNRYFGSSAQEALNNLQAGGA